MAADIFHYLVFVTGPASVILALTLLVLSLRLENVLGGLMGDITKKGSIGVGLLILASVMQAIWFEVPYFSGLNPEIIGTIVTSLNIVSYVFFLLCLKDMGKIASLSRGGSPGKK
jgi:hypothetical protein